jgi:hypothetical protein
VKDDSKHTTGYQQSGEENCFICPNYWNRLVPLLKQSKLGHGMTLDHSEKFPERGHQISVEKARLLYSCIQQQQSKSRGFNNSSI